jgi:hypothetical protein
MSRDLANAYNEFLQAAAVAVTRGDKFTAMACLKQALRAANACHTSSHYRRKVMRAMNFTRCLP